MLPAPPTPPAPPARRDKYPERAQALVMFRLPAVRRDSIPAPATSLARLVRRERMPPAQGIRLARPVRQENTLPVQVTRLVRPVPRDTTLPAQETLPALPVRQDAKYALLRQTAYNAKPDGHGTVAFVLSISRSLDRAITANIGSNLPPPAVRATENQD